MDDAGRSTRPRAWRAEIVPIAAVLGALAGWLWPLGVGGRMPAGGDVTRFSIGLMDFLHRSLRAGRLPLWNDLWGFGFPGLAESQMGVYYPPHLLLYGLFPTEIGYTLSLVAHTAWAGLGAYWAARRFGASPRGAALGSFAWAASGFFVIHLPHQWGYTTGSWMPWAWGLAWPLARGEGSPRSALKLAAVLAIQTLPGHFQLAFITQAGVLVLAGWGLIDQARGRRRALLGAFGIATAVGFALPLVAAQLLPTWELARQAGSARDFEYLSGFAATPVHLVSYVAPGLFHVSPLWRPVAWDPFHTSPEEHLAYIGLAPLLLAFLAIAGGWRRDVAVRALVVVAVASLVLSLGPYAPGFRELIRLPGFSFFRAPARWGLATELALALLAARGFDAVASWKSPVRGVLLFVAGAVLYPAILVLGFEAALESTGRPGRPAVAEALDQGLELLPWPGTSLRRIMAQARDPVSFGLVRSELLRRGRNPQAARLDRERFSTYAAELGPTAGLAAALLALLLVRRRRRFEAGLAVLTVVDLLWLGGQQRAVGSAPLRPLTAQSAVLDLLAHHPRGTRSIDGEGNLVMTAGAANLSPYRTLDRPLMRPLTSLAGSLNPAGPEPPTRAAGRILGAGVRVFTPEERRYLGAAMARWPGRPRVVRDEALARWEHGPRAVAANAGLAGYALADLDAHPARAWFLPTPTEGASRRLLLATDEPRGLLRHFEGARPASWRSPAPERVEVDVDAAGPGYAVVTQLDDPEWRCRLSGPSGEREAPVVRLFGNADGAGWQGVRIPAAGRWTLRLDYRGRAAYRGLAITGAAWLAWIVSYGALGRGTARRGEEVA